MGTKTEGTYYIGLSCTGHDNSLAIVDGKDGSVVFAEATERYLQNKRAWNTPPDDIYRTGKIIDQYCPGAQKLVITKSWSSESLNALDTEHRLILDRIDTCKNSTKYLYDSFEILQKIKSDLETIKNEVDTDLIPQLSKLINGYEEDHLKLLLLLFELNKSEPNKASLLNKITQQYNDAYDTMKNLNPGNIAQARTDTIDYIGLDISQRFKDKSDMNEMWHKRHKALQWAASFVKKNIEYSGEEFKHHCKSIGIDVEFKTLEAQLSSQENQENSFNHHRTHAATACFTSPFKKAACMVVDGYGERAAVSYYTYDNGKITRFDTSVNDNSPLASLGFFYAAVVCRLCGFSGLEGEEWKVMGLAPYGKVKKELLEVMKEYIRVDGLKVIHPEETAEKAYYTLLTTYSRQTEQTDLDVADIAHTGQYYFSEMMTELLNTFYDKINTGKNSNEKYAHIALGGGCALNSSFAGRVLKKTSFKKLHIPSAPADDGNAVGAALLAYYDENPGEQPSEKSRQSPYLGSELSQKTLDNLTKFSGIPNLFHAGKDAFFQSVKSGDHLLYRKVDRNFDNSAPTHYLKVLPNHGTELAPVESDMGILFTTVAQHIADGKIIGWVQGRAEFGPRALGNRSILADPRRKDMKDIINGKIKFREGFRPFAPSILHEYGKDYFHDYESQETPYMERVLHFKEEVKKKIPAVVHQDGTGRLQSVYKEWNPRYHELITTFYKLTGIPLVINTSLNVMGKPIVHSVEDAIALLYTSGLDVLVLGDIIIEK